MQRKVGECGDLNKNGSQRLIDLNAWLPGSGTIRKGRSCGLDGVGVVLLGKCVAWHEL